MNLDVGFGNELSATVSHQIQGTSALDEMIGDVLFHILSLLSPNDQLRMREVSKRFSALPIPSDPWKEKFPQANFLQVWEGGPSFGSFHNIALNLVIHRIQLELGAWRPVISRYRESDLSIIINNIKNLENIAILYLSVGTLHKCFQDISNKLWNHKNLTAYLEEIGPRDLEHKGNSEKRLVQFFRFLNGEPFDKNSPLYIAPKPGEPKPLVELISDELALRARINQAPDADRLPLLEELLANGVYLIIQDFRNASHACLRAHKFDKAAAHYEAVLARLGADASTQDFRNASLAHYTAKHYQQMVAHLETILTRPDATAQDFRHAGNARFGGKYYEKATAHYEAVLARVGADATTQDFRNAGLAQFHAKHYEKAALHFEAALAHPDCTDQERNNIEQLRLKNQSESKG